MKMTFNQVRPSVINLCQVGGISPARLSELADCDLDRARAIISRELMSVQPGTLTLSEPNAVAKALDIVYSVDN